MSRDERVLFVSGTNLVFAVNVPIIRMVYLHSDETKESHIYIDYQSSVYVHIMEIVT